MMELYDLWFVLISVLFIGFFFLEGFDYGVGILLPFLGKNDHRTPPDHQHDWPGVGCERSLDDHGGRRDFRRVPAVVRDPVQRLLSRAGRDPAGADRARRGVRVPQQRR